ncbi:MAG: phage tail tape measure protein [Gammaproteobacteria bacterium]|nr:phage tail tape measure protein [Gammaproteobacteria bacterium]
MADRNLALQLLITARDQASSVLSSLKTQLAALAAVITSLFSLKTGIELEDSLAKLRARADETGPALEALIERARKAASELGPKFGYSTTEAADALTVLVAAGFKADEAIEALPGVLALARLENLQLAQAAELVSDVLSQFKLKATEAGNAADIMAKAAGLVAASATDMGESIKYSGAAAHTAGYTLTQTTAILSALAKAGLRGSEGGTALSSVLTILANPAHAATQRLFELGAASTELGDVLDFIKGQGLKAADIIALFGEQAGRAINILVAQGGKAGLKSFEEGIASTGKTAQEAAAIMQNTLGQALNAFWNTVKRISADLAQPKLEPFRQGVNAATDALNRFASSETIAGVQQRIGVVFSSIGESAQSLYESLKKGIDLSAIWQGLEAGAEIAKGAFNRVSEAWLQLFAQVTGSAPNLESVFKTTSVGIGAAWEQLLSLFETGSKSWSKLIDGIREGLSQAENAAEQLANQSAETGTKLDQGLSASLQRAQQAADQARASYQQAVDAWQSGAGSQEAVTQAAARQQQALEHLAAETQQVTQRQEGLAAAVQDLGHELDQRDTGAGFIALMGEIGRVTGAVLKEIQDFATGSVQALSGFVRDIDFTPATATFDALKTAISNVSSLFENQLPNMKQTGQDVADALTVVFGGISVTINSVGAAISGLIAATLDGYRKLRELTGAEAAVLNELKAQSAALSETANGFSEAVARSAESVNAALERMGQQFKRVGEETQTFQEQGTHLEKSLDQQTQAVNQKAEALIDLEGAYQKTRDAQDQTRTATDQSTKVLQEHAEATQQAADAQKTFYTATDFVQQAFETANVSAGKYNIAINNIELNQQAAIASTKKFSIEWANIAAQQQRVTESSGKIGKGFYEIKSASDQVTGSFGQQRVTTQALIDAQEKYNTAQARSAENSQNTITQQDALRIAYEKSKAQYEAAEEAFARGEINEQQRNATRRTAEDALHRYNIVLQQSEESTKKVTEAVRAANEAALEEIRGEIELAQAKGDTWTVRRKTVTLAQLEAELAAKEADAKLAEVQAEQASVKAKIAQAEAIKNKTAADIAEIEVLQQKLAALGKEAEAAQLGVKVKMALADAASTNTAATRDNTAATRDNTDATQENNETKNKAKKSSESIGSALAKEWAYWREITQALSDATYQLSLQITAEDMRHFQMNRGIKAQQSFNVELIKTADSAEEVVLAYKELQRKLNEAEVWWRRQGTAAANISKAFTAIQDGGIRASLAYYEQRVQLEKLIETMDKAGSIGGANMTIVEQATSRATHEFELLNDQELGRLRSAIDDAKERLRAMEDATRSAKDRLAELNAELLEAQGFDQKAELLRQQLDYTQQLADIEAQRQQAEASGQRELIAVLDQQRRVLEEINRAKVANIQADTDATEKTVNSANAVGAALRSVSDAAEVLNGKTLSNLISQTNQLYRSLAAIDEIL